LPRHPFIFVHSRLAGAQSVCLSVVCLSVVCLSVVCLSVVLSAGLCLDSLLQHERNEKSAGGHQIHYAGAGKLGQAAAPAGDRPC
jgi:hypothetical protein